LNCVIESMNKLKIPPSREIPDTHFQGGKFQGEEG
jgi:hypothetical protein